MRRMDWSNHSCEVARGFIFGIVMAGEAGGG